MQLLPLVDVAGQLKPGMPLPWGVRDASGQLLLARGHRISDPNMLQNLLDRGMFVDAIEVRAASGRSDAISPPQEGFFGRWRLMSARLNTLLQAQPPSDLRSAMEEVVAVLISLGDRDPDKLLFQILRHDGSRHQTYGVAHSLHAASVVCLTAKRLGWCDEDRRSVVGAALTMNLSMVELQGRLAAQATPLTADQRAQIRSHPERSARMLSDGGVTDAKWLQAVEDHHELPDGKGYPKGSTTPCEMSQMLRLIDIFTAKLSARASRQAILPHQAARELFVQNQGHASAAALIKEFGIYPPGCFVKLVSGETGIVVRRGQNANTPQVAAITNRNGDALSQPVRRDTAHKDYAVVTVVPEANVMVRVPWETLYPD